MTCGFQARRLQYHRIGALQEHVLYYGSIEKEALLGEGLICRWKGKVGQENLSSLPSPRSWVAIPCGSMGGYPNTAEPSTFPRSTKSPAKRATSQDGLIFGIRRSGVGWWLEQQHNCLLKSRSCLCILFLFWGLTLKITQ